MTEISMTDTGDIPAATPHERAGGPPDLPPAVPPTPRSGCLTALMVIGGVILLLPGLCAIIFGSIALSQQQLDNGVLPLVAVGLVIGFFGVVMIWAAFRSPRP
jgi:hypothetical protein